MLVGRDLNLNLRGVHGNEFIGSMRIELGIDLSNNVGTSTTSTSRNLTYIDAIFYRHIKQLETREYISYFSTHRPLLSITRHSYAVNDENVVFTVYKKVNYNLGLVFSYLVPNPTVLNRSSSIFLYRPNSIVSRQLCPTLSYHPLCL